MTNWRSNRSIPNLVEFRKRLNEQVKLNNVIAADESEIPPWAKFEFDDKDRAEVNRHADLPDDARHELESVIYSYLVSCLRAGQTEQRNIKNEFKRLAKKADTLSKAFDNLSGAAMNMGNPILNKHKAAVADLRDWAAKMVQACGKQHPNPDPSARNRLISDAVMIYNGYGKTSFKDFRDREPFIFELLEIAGVEMPEKAGKKGVKKNEEAIKKLIRAWRRQNWRIFPRRRTVNN